MALLAALLRRLRKEQGGFTLIEVSVGVMILTGGIIGLVSSFDGARDMTSQSELKEAATHRAELEIERLRSYGYAALAHQTAPTPSTDPNDPRSRISGTPPRFAYDQKNSAATEPLVVDSSASGKVQVGPDTYNDGRLGYKVWRFVTQASDPSCGASGSKCLDTDSYYKRITVVVAVTGLRNNLKPIWISSLVADPSDAPVDNQTAPYTECLDGSGNAIECRNSTSDNVNSWFLLDTPASASGRQTINASHALHPTITPPAGGARMPDLMSTTGPPGANPPPPVYSYSSDQPGGYTGGRKLARDVACNATPTADNLKGAFWATAPLASAKVLNGSGGLSLYSYTLNGVQAAGTLCLAFYDVGGDLSTIGSSPPTEIGRSSFQTSSWPKAAEAVSFAFDFRATDTVTVPAGHRIGMRLWMSSASGSDVALVYDHPSYGSYLQLDEPGS